MKNINPRHIKAARALLDWNQEELADRAKVGVATLRRIEGTDGELPETKAAEKIVAALKAAGIAFQNHGKPGVRLREPGE